MTPKQTTSALGGQRIWREFLNINCLHDFRHTAISWRLCREALLVLNVAKSFPASVNGSVFFFFQLWHIKNASRCEHLVTHPLVFPTRFCTEAALIYTIWNWTFYAVQNSVVVGLKQRGLLLLAPKPCADCWSRLSCVKGTVVCFSFSFFWIRALYAFNFFYGTLSTNKPAVLAGNMFVCASINDATPDIWKQFVYLLAREMAKRLTTKTNCKVYSAFNSA